MITFLIQPATDGKFQYHDNKVIFIPDTHLERDIDYTITIKKGYNNGKEALEKKDHVFSFHTNNYASKSTGIYLRGVSWLYDLSSTRWSSDISMLFR